MATSTLIDGEKLELNSSLLEQEVLLLEPKEMVSAALSSLPRLSYAAWTIITAMEENYNADSRV